MIPTCDRRVRLLSLLQNLDRSVYPVDEVIIVDSGSDQLLPGEYSVFRNLRIQYVLSEKSVCIQRNIGIRMARSPWVFLCDDDIELPNDYLQALVGYIALHPEAGAVSGLWMEKINGEWKGSHRIRSARALLWRYIFGLSIWGEVDCDDNNFLIRRIKQFYRRKGNHISKAGWPVNTDFTGENIICPVYSLGASLVKKDWLVSSPFDEVLDRHGIGDNYGVLAGFPAPGIHIASHTFVFHHIEPTNRLKRSLQYYRRVLALDYFAKTKPALRHVKKYHIVWSLTGQLIGFLWGREGIMIRAALKLILKITFNRNPYFTAGRENRKVIEPVL